MVAPEERPTRARAATATERRRDENTGIPLGRDADGTDTTD
jgi:hypothetical protein